MFMDIDVDTHPVQQHSPIHKASLVDASLHSPALLELLHIKLSQPVIEYVVDCVVETVDYAMNRPSSSAGRHRTSRKRETAAFTTFVTDVLSRAEVTMPVILASLVYVDRAKPHLHIALEEWACERVFLGAVMLASKYLNDSTLKNVHWALCTGVFGKRDVGRIERELLDVLDFELGILEADILSHHDGLSAVALHHHAHRRNHSRHSTHYVPLPALEVSHPESPSSSGSSSIYTPKTPSSPSFSPETKAKHQIDLSPSHPKPSYSQSTLDILRSFPIPIPRVQRASVRSPPSKRYSTFASSQNHRVSRFNPIEQPLRQRVLA
jgi:hypothetical protein